MKNKTFWAFFTILTLVFTVSCSSGESTADSRPSSTSSNRSSSAGFASFPTISLSGRGDDIVDINKSEAPGVVELSHQGSSNFSVWSHGTDGERLALLVNVIGPYRGIVPIDFLVGEHTGRFEISADGSLTLNVKPLSLLRKARVPGTISGKGDEVITLTGSSPDIASITHTGNSNFSIWSYGSSRDLLVNEIGNYTGRIILDSDTLVLTIGADGPWSIDITAR